MIPNIKNRILLKIMDQAFSRQKKKSDKQLNALILEVTRLAMEPVGEPKVPLYRKRHQKKNAFKVIKGGLSEKRKD